MYRDLIFSRSFQFALLTLFSSLVYSAEESITEQTYLQEFPVVLTASRLSQPLSESPNAMTIIDRQMIQSSGFRSVVDIFRLVPGMYVGNAGANLPFVSLNGVTDQYSRRMQVLVDGCSIYLPPFGGVDWSSLPLHIEEIERIEVVRGPSAASHGTNSFYGVINVITKDSATVAPDSLSLSKGEIGIANISAQHSGASERLDYRLAYAYREDDGDNPEILNDSSNNSTFSVRSNFRVNSTDTIEFQLGLSAANSGKGTVGLSDRDPFRIAKTHNDFQQISWRSAWNTEDETKLTYYRINREYKDPQKGINWNSNVNPKLFGVDFSRGLRHDFELQNTHQLGHANRIVWGGGFRYDHAEQPLIFSSAYGLKQSRIFFHDEWRPMDVVVLNIGTMFEDDGAGHKNNSPRISLNYHIHPQHTLRALYATATRNPVMAEMYLTTEANQYWKRGYLAPGNALRPEKIVSKEIGYVGKIDRLSLDARVYYEEVRDIIGLDYYATLSKSSFKNLSDGVFKGLEISTHYQWDGGNLVFNYARQKSSCHFSSFPSYYSDSIYGPTVVAGYQKDFLNLCSETVPADSASLLLTQQLFESIEFSTGYYFRDSVRVLDVASQYPAESTMHRVDIRLAKKFGNIERPGGGEFAVILQNAFQDNYTGYGNEAQMANLLFKRRTYLTASVFF